MNPKQEKRFWSADQKRFVYSLRQSMDCLFSSQGNSLNVKKKYGMIKGRTDKDTRITEVFRYNGTVQAEIY